MPRPLSSPHPPILIGGHGEKKTLRFVARYVDAMNVGTSFTDDGVDLARRKLDVLRAHCEREGRPYDRIEKTVLLTLMVRPEGGGFWLTPEAALSVLRRMRDLGVDQAVFNMPNVDHPERLEYAAENIVRPMAAW